MSGLANGQAADQWYVLWNNKILKHTFGSFLINSLIIILGWTTRALGQVSLASIVWIQGSSLALTL